LWYYVAADRLSIARRELMPAVPINDTHIFYIDIGSGIPTLVMHGGLGQDHTFMHPYLDSLGDVMRLFYYDHRGNGRSGRPDVESLTMRNFVEDAESLRRHLGFEKMAVIASSFGGFIALEYALKYPASVSHLILADTVAVVDYGPEIVANAQRKTNDPEVLQEFLEPSADDDIAFTYHMSAIAPLYFHRYDEKVANNLIRDKVLSATAYARNGPLVAEYDVSQRLGEISAPTLIIVGDDDFITPPWQAQRLHKGIRNSEFVVLPQSGHYSHVERPELFCTVVRAWLGMLAQKSASVAAE
jgi:proline iminopeptidase